MWRAMTYTEPNDPIILTTVRNDRSLRSTSVRSTPWRLRVLFAKSRRHDEHRPNPPQPGRKDKDGQSRQRQLRWQVLLEHLFHGECLHPLAPECGRPRGLLLWERIGSDVRGELQRGALDWQRERSDSFIKTSRCGIQSAATRASPTCCVGWDLSHERETGQMRR